MDIELLNQMLDIARWAPSGGNAQPWLIEIQSESKPLVKISIDSDYAANPSLMDVDGSGSIMALGAFLENLTQLADKNGYLTQTKIVEPRQPYTDFFSAHIEIEFSKKSNFEKNPIEIRSLTQLIKTRHTNRNKFKTDKLPNEFQNWIKTEITNENLSLNVFESEKSELIKQLKFSDKIRLGHKGLLESLLTEITLKDEKYLTGIPLHVLGADKMGELTLTLFKKRPFTRNLLKLGASAVFAQQAIQNPITNAGAFIYIGAPMNNAFYLVKLGQMIQRIWLKAFSHHIGMQPFAGHLIAYHHLTSPRTYELSKELSQQIDLAEKTYQQDWGISLKNPLFGFRIGYPTKESQSSPRKELSQIVKITAKKSIA